MNKKEVQEKEMELLPIGAFDMIVHEPNISIFY